MSWKVRTNAAKSLYLQMDKNTKVLLLPDDGNVPENLRATYYLGSIFDEQKPTKQPKVIS